jgi:hypothetical protein
MRYIGTAQDVAQRWTEVLTMDDLIDREAVLPILAGLARTQDEYDESYDKLMQIPSANRWIPCSERLPEVYEKVLTYNDEGIIHDNFRLNLRDGSVGWSQGWGITHWQPRPEPPDNG